MKALRLLIPLLIVSCGSGENSSESLETDFHEVISDEEISMLKAPPAEEGTTPHFEKKLVKRGNLAYQVKDVSTEYNHVATLLNSFNAYLTSENQSRDYDRINFNLSIKVPPEKFDSLIVRLAEGRKIDSKWVNIDDVTERYYDLHSRIDNKKKLEKRYQEILKKANTVKDMLEVERSLNSVRATIESLEGQLQLLKHQISYSTLDINFYEILPRDAVRKKRLPFGTRVNGAISDGWHGFLSFMVFVVRLWPYIIMIFFVVILIRKIRHGRKNK